MSMMTMTPILPNPFWSICLYAALVPLPFHQNWSEVKKSFHLILSDLRYFHLILLNNKTNQKIISKHMKTQFENGQNLFNIYYSK